MHRMIIPLFKKIILRLADLYGIKEGRNGIYCLYTLIYRKKRRTSGAASIVNNPSILAHSTPFCISQLKKMNKSG